LNYCSGRSIHQFTEALCCLVICQRWSKKESHEVFIAIFVISTMFILLSEFFHSHVLHLFRSNWHVDKMTVVLRGKKFAVDGTSASLAIYNGSADGCMRFLFWTARLCTNSTTLIFFVPSLLDKSYNTLNSWCFTACFTASQKEVEGNGGLGALLIALKARVKWWRWALETSRAQFTNCLSKYKELTS